MKAVENYLAQVDPSRQGEFRQLFEVVCAHIPEGFELTFEYGMIAFVVPLSVYPAGYLNRPDEPVPFISLGAQKRHIALYHMGIMSNPTLLTWFQEEYRNVMPTKLNMGKSCIRFTNAKKIPYELIAELVSKISLVEWLASYERFMAMKASK